MSKQIKAKLTCPNCQHQFNFTLYRTIWGEFPDNRELVMSDRINVATCPSCKKITKLDFPFFYTNQPQHFAVWWEPEYDPQIDVDSHGYARLFGGDSYMASAPRIKDWNEFKETILKFEKGELEGEKEEITQETESLLEGFVEYLKAGGLGDSERPKKEDEIPEIIREDKVTFSEKDEQPTQSVSLTIRGDMQDSREITEGLGFEPTRYRKKGDEVHLVKGLVYPLSVWRYDVPIDEKEGLDVHINYLWSKLINKKEYLYFLKEKYQLEVTVTYKKSTALGFSIPYRSLEMFSELELPFGMYLVDEQEKKDPKPQFEKLNKNNTVREKCPSCRRTESLLKKFLIDNLEGESEAKTEETKSLMEGFVEYLKNEMASGVEKNGAESMGRVGISGEKESERKRDNTMGAQSNKQDKSHVRSWANRRYQELRSSNDLSPEHLFAMSMWSLTFFGEKDLESKPFAIPDGMEFDFSESYSGDATLFELGCYLYFRIDLWMYQNKPKQREKFSTVFTNEFINLFTDALGSTNLSVLFEERISGFGQLIRTGADVEKFHFYLSQLILLAKDDHLPKSYDFETSPLMAADFFEDMGIKMALLAWEREILPTMIESLKFY